MPWHIYRALPSIDRAEIICHFREHGIREGYRAKKVQAAADPGVHGDTRDAYLG